MIIFLLRKAISRLAYPVWPRQKDLHVPWSLLNSTPYSRPTTSMILFLHLISFSRHLLPFTSFLYTISMILSFLFHSISPNHLSLFLLITAVTATSTPQCPRYFLLDHLLSLQVTLHALRRCLITKALTLDLCSSSNVYVPHFIH